MSNHNNISKGFDWSIIWLYIFLVIIGVSMIFANEYKEGESIIQPILSQSRDYGKQVLWVGVCTVLATFILLTDSKFFTATANLLYGFGIFLCILALLIGTEVKGSKSWIVLGGFRLQPSELTKVFTCLALAKYISRQETDFSKMNSHLIGAAIALAPAIVTIAQNETGLALVYFSFFLVMYREGLPPFILIAGASMAVLLILSLILAPQTLLISFTVFAALALLFSRRQFRRKPVIFWGIIALWGFASFVSAFAIPYGINKVMKPYQRDRLYSLVGKPYIPQDSLERAELEISKASKKSGSRNQSEYNVIQSKIAIGSGGLFGKGWLNGSQSHLHFLPEHSTDFIFAACGEEFGFIGSIILIALFMFVVIRGLIITINAQDTFTRLLAGSLTLTFFVSFFVNMGMVTGIVPVVGIPLPLISYGGSSMVTLMASFGILMSIQTHRKLLTT